MKTFLLLLLLCAMPSVVLAQPAPNPVNPASVLVWDQDMSSSLAPATADTVASVFANALVYTLYVDGIAMSLPGHKCAAPPQSPMFTCNANLPPLTVGVHALELTAKDISTPSAPAESGRSVAVNVRFYIAPAAPSNIRLGVR